VTEKVAASSTAKRATFPAVTRAYLMNRSKGTKALPKESLDHTVGAEMEYSSLSQTLPPGSDFSDTSLGGDIIANVAAKVTTKKNVPGEHVSLAERTSFLSARLNCQTP
jgi:hypothetical protein